MAVVFVFAFNDAGIVNEVTANATAAVAGAVFAALAVRHVFNLDDVGRAIGRRAGDDAFLRPSLGGFQIVEALLSVGATGLRNLVDVVAFVRVGPVR